MLLPMVEPRERASRRMNRNTICTLTCRSTAVRLMGAALENGLSATARTSVGATHVALRMSFVSWPVNTTRP